jgi:membrane-associated protease RseP (regulator of RpoE activity)
MEYKLVYYPYGTNNVIGIVLYVIPGSPAAKAGFTRGDIFSSVNGQKLTGSNYSQLLNTQEKLTYTLAKIDKDGVLEEGAIKTRDVAPVVLQEDPVFLIHCLLMELIKLAMWFTTSSSPSLTKGMIRSMTKIGRDFCQI